MRSNTDLDMIGTLMKSCRKYFQSNKGQTKIRIACNVYLNRNSVFFIHFEVGHQPPDFLLGTIHMVLKFDHIVILKQLNGENRAAAGHDPEEAGFSLGGSIQKLNNGFPLSGFS